MAATYAAVIQRSSNWWIGRDIGMTVEAFVRSR